MSSSTIIKLRQKEASFVEQNGSFKTTLNNPLTVNQGDIIQFKNCFLDTSTDIIKVDSPIDIKIEGVRYITNTKEDNVAGRFEGVAGGVKFYEPQASYTGAGNGDGKKYFESITTTTVNGDEFALSFRYRLAPNAIRMKATDFKFEYIDLAGNTQHLSYHEPFSFKGQRVVNFNKKHADQGIAVRGTSVKIIQPTKSDCRHNGIDFESIVVEYKTVAPTNGLTYLVPKLRSFEYTLPEGLYAPGEIAQLITDEMSRADSAGAIGSNPQIGNANALFPVNSAFLGTIGQIANDDNLNGTNTKFVAEDGSLIMAYNVGAGGAAQALDVPNGDDAYVGASNTVLEFDENTNKMRFQALHTPIFVSQTGAGAGDSNGQQGVQFIGATGVSALQYSGFVIQNLEPREFWFDQLGVSNEIIPQFHDETATLTLTQAGNPMGAGLGTGTVVNVKSCSEVKEGITTTGAFEGLSLALNTNRNFMQPLVTGDVQTDVSSTLFFNKIFNTGFAQDGFFMISINGISQDLRGSLESNFTTNTPNQDSKSIQAIVGSYYSNGNFTQAGGESSITYEHTSETPLVLSEIETRVLLPDMTKPGVSELGDRNCIFLEVIRNNAPKKV